MNAMSQEWSPQGAPGYGPTPPPSYGPSPTPSYGPSPTPGYGPTPTAGGQPSYGPTPTPGYGPSPTAGGQPGYAGYQTAPAPGSSLGPATPQVGAPKPKDDNPFAALLDFEFRRYATPGLIKIIYIVLLVAIGLSMLFGLVSGLSMLSSQWTVGMGVLTMLASGVGAVVSVLLVRIGLEYAIATIRMSSDIAKMREESQSDGSPSAAGRP